MLINNDLFIEIDSCQRIANGCRLSGDVYLQKRLDDSLISVLFCGGNGASIKGNIAASILSSMTMKHIEKYNNIAKVAETIISMIMISSQQQNSTSSKFTIVKIDNKANVDVICYGTPKPLYFKGNKYNCLKATVNNFTTEYGNGGSYESYSFKSDIDDRLVFFNDLKVSLHKELDSDCKSVFWDNTVGIINNVLDNDTTISAIDVAKKLILESYNYNNKCDISGDQSCGVVYFRKPRKVLLCSGPPYEQHKDKYLANKVKDYKGDVILCGGTTAGIVSRELDREVSVLMGRDPSGLPNESTMDGVDMITEGVLTMGRVRTIFENISDPTVKGRGIDIKLARNLLNHDVVDILVGTRINSMHQDPNIPVEL